MTNSKKDGRIVKGPKNQEVVRERDIKLKILKDA